MTIDSHTHVESPLAHQFDDLEQQRAAADLGMWLFLATELMFFAGLFLTYFLYRLNDEAAFAAASHHLDVVWGTVNTAVLLTSSLTVAISVHAAQSRDQRKLTQLLAATIGLGTLFVAIKGWEYHGKYQHGLMPLMGLPFRWDVDSTRPGAELFYDLYYVMTGVHLLHMVIGLGLMLVLLVKAMRGGLLGDFATPVRMIGLYWHFVDVIWVFLFPLLYLIGAHP
ncbi:cytochrome c oxidase subunit 3 family protein [Schlesneria sp. DSM 10557]|uniref:cytochrome c oxidase subunit 3 family protein n=1 Tax=Schlesneria sp. DSM 10557 TaxID=3044399 RepID=UPI0035A047BC